MNHGITRHRPEWGPRLLLGQALHHRQLWYKFLLSEDEPLHRPASACCAPWSVVYYRYSTSNHNYVSHTANLFVLSIIVILHQTTTCSGCKDTNKCCLLSLFYIKPQPRIAVLLQRVVVYYRYSTSNHNVLSIETLLFHVVYYRYSTSNHNHARHSLIPTLVVYYRYSTSNHNW